MSMESAIREHLDEGDVIRLLDGEASAEERAEWTAHLEGCERCRRLTDEIGDSSAWFRSSLSLFDDQARPDDVTKARALAALRSRLAVGSGAPPAEAGGVPALNGSAPGRRVASPRNGQPLYRLAAAGVGIILFAGLTVAPVRAWIRDNILGMRAEVEAPAPDAVIEPAPAAPAAASAGAGFNVRGPTFVVDFGERQPEGTLTVRLTSEAQASAEIVGGSEVPLVVLPSGLQIGNEAESKASYVVELPADKIGEVVVRAGGQLLGSRTLSAAGEEVELDLATGTVVP